MTMRKASFLIIGSALTMVAFATSASAEDKASKGASGGVITADTVHIVLRPPRPLAATEITKIVPTRPLAELRQPFLDRVEKAIEQAPF
jgi:hypothetical protein